MDLDLRTGRRAVLLGGTGALAAAFLAACSDEKPAETGATAPTNTTTPPAPDPASDLQLSRTFASLEALAIDTYGSVLKSGPLTTPDVLAMAKLFQQHHQTQLNSVNQDVVSGGDKEVTDRNEAVYEELVKPKLAAAASEGAAIAFLSEMEHALAQTYTWSSGPEGFTTPDFRKKAITIAGIDARHAAVLDIVFEKEPPDSIFPGSGFFDATNAFADIDGAMLEE
jgi:hypothetical protein